jgi:hypothetical protein
MIFSVDKPFIKYVVSVPNEIRLANNFLGNHKWPIIPYDYNRYLYDMDTNIIDIAINQMDKLVSKTGKMGLLDIADRESFCFWLLFFNIDSIIDIIVIPNDSDNCSDILLKTFNRSIYNIYKQIIELNSII